MKYFLGVALIVFAIFILGGTYLPVLRNEINYDLGKYQQRLGPKAIEPVDTNFGIVIPKINANARVIKDVDPYDPKIYQQALTKGVAHAKGSALPGEKGNIFLFSHSSSDFINATKYNSIFYLLTKLEKGDQIRLYYQTKSYVYLVEDKKIVNSDAITYLTNQTNKESLTLMTCWPPGTSLKRLIITALPQ